MADQRAVRLAALARLGSGEEGTEYAAHREIMRPDLRDYRLGAEEPIVGVEAYVEALRDFRQAVSDFAVDVPIPPIVDGAYVTTSWTYRGRMTGPIWGIAPSDRRFTWRGCSIWTFDDEDRITELRTFADIGELLRQIAPT